MMIARPWRATLLQLLKPILVSKSKQAVSEYICRVMSKMSPTRSSSVYKVRVEDFYPDLSTDIYKMKILESIKEGGCLASDPDVQEGGTCHTGDQWPCSSHIASDVLFPGSYDVGPQGKLRMFLGYPHCRDSIGLVKGKTYLIMGTSRDIHKDEQEQTWVCSIWPTFFMMTWFLMTFSVSVECSIGNWPQEDLNWFILCLSRFQYVLGERTWIEYWPTAAECQTGEHRPTCLGMDDMVEQYTIFGCLNK